MREIFETPPPLSLSLSQILKMQLEHGADAVVIVSRISRPEDPAAPPKRSPPLNEARPLAHPSSSHPQPSFASVKPFEGTTASVFASLPASQIPSASFSSLPPLFDVAWAVDGWLKMESQAALPLTLQPLPIVLQPILINISLSSLPKPDSYQ